MRKIKLNFNWTSTEHELNLIGWKTYLFFCLVISRENTALKTLLCGNIVLKVFPETASSLQETKWCWQQDPRESRGRVTRWNFLPVLSPQYWDSNLCPVAGTKQPPQDTPPPSSQQHPGDTWPSLPSVCYNSTRLSINWHIVSGLLIISLRHDRR